MLREAILQLDQTKEGVDYRFGYIHNPSHSTIDDLIETHWQLYQAQQISYPYFYTISAMLSEITGNIPADEIWGIINNVVTDYNNDIVTMLHKYQEESFDQKHNVLLVTHSQGNLFGNKMYTFLTDKQKQKFRMVSIATPASYVKVPGQFSPYVTVVGDPVINIIPNALDGNVDGIGHEFVSTYLVGSINAPRKIALHVKSSYDDLLQTTSCTEYKFTRVTMPEFGILKVDGNIDYGKDEEVGRVTLEIHDANWDDIQELYTCTPSKNSVHWGGNNYIGDNWTDFNGTYNQWIPGTHISNHSTLDNSSSIKDTVLYDNQCITISLEKNGELYQMIYDMFPE